MHDFPFNYLANVNLSGFLSARLTLLHPPTVLTMKGVFFFCVPVNGKVEATSSMVRPINSISLQLRNNNSIDITMKITIQFDKKNVRKKSFAL